MNKKEVIDIIYEVLADQDFEDWFKGEFESHICGGDGRDYLDGKKSIKADIGRMFHRLCK